MLFRDRIDAGLQLAHRLQHFSFHRPIILALPRGGVPIAKVIADQIHAPLEILVVRKIGAPGHAELGIGALAEDGDVMFNQPLIRRLSIDPEYLEKTIEREKRELNRRIQMYRHGKALSSVAGRDVVIVDDGLATGYTAAAAAQYIHQKGARHVTLAVPVCALDSECFLEHYVDQVLCLKPCEPLYSIGMWYENFEQMTDEEVVALLNGSKNEDFLQM